MASDSDPWRERLRAADLNLYGAAVVETRRRQYVVPHRVRAEPVKHVYVEGRCTSDPSRNGMPCWYCTPDWLIEWEYVDGEPQRHSPRESGCLASFLALHDAAGQPERVVSFCRRYGTLKAMCEHGRSLWECRKCEHDLSDWLGCTKSDVGVDKAWDFYLAGEYLRTALLLRVVAKDLFEDTVESDYFEDTAAIFKLAFEEQGLERRQPIPLPKAREVMAYCVFLARKMRAVLGMLADLRADRDVRPNDIGTLAEEAGGKAYRDDVGILTKMTGVGVSLENDDIEVRAHDALGHWATTRGRSERNRQDDRFWLLETANAMIRDLGRPEASLEWDENDRGVHYVYMANGLAGTLGTELAAAMCSPYGIFRCDNCDEAFAAQRGVDGQVRRRRPPTTGRQRIYCDACWDKGKYGPVHARRKREQYQATHPAKYNTRYRQKDTGQPE